MKEFRESNFELFSNCCSLLQEFSATEKTSETQLACALLLQDNATILLKDPKNILGDLKLAFWQTVFDLLQEDDLDVKDTTAKIFNKLQPTHPIPVHCVVATDCLLKELLSSSPDGFPQNTNFLQTVISWMCPTHFPSHEMKERLFDRGEMNTYRDNVYFLQTLASHLNIVLGAYNNKNAQSTPEILQIQNGNIQSSLGENINQVSDPSFINPSIKRQFLTTSRQLIERLAQTKPHKLTNVFWDTAVHQADVQDCFQYLLALSSLQRLLPQAFSTSEEELVKSLQTVSTQIQIVFGSPNYIVDNLSVKLLLILENMQEYWTIK